MRFTAVLTACTLLIACPAVLAAREVEQPNIVIIYADDLGYGDLGWFDESTSHTPNLDEMANEGMRFTQFYSADTVCTPSRAALMTGRLPIRSGMTGDQRRVLFPDSQSGLPSDEITLPEVLREQGYATAAVGKWHLGHVPQHLPTRNGFDSYFGIPYSNDMNRADGAPHVLEAFRNPKSEYWNVPLMRDEEIIELPAKQETITRRYTEEAIRFIGDHKEGPFFLYFAHTMPHVPLFRSEAFVDYSGKGLYGDVIAEIDWSVGRILDTLRGHGLEERTLVWFSSDNGPWLLFSEHAGSAGPLRGGKVSTWEGGMRAPTLAWWPGTVPAGTESSELGSTIDFFTTSIELAGGRVPQDRIIDSVDLRPVLFGEGLSPRKEILYYYGTRLTAIRRGPWKVHFATASGNGGGLIQHDPPQLYHLERDPGETDNLAPAHPEILVEFEQIATEHRAKLDPPASLLDVAQQSNGSKGS